MQARYDYDPYGRRTKITGTLDASFGFTGHYVHAPSNLHLALYRAYDPALGRWLNRDPVGEHEMPNLYQYAENDSVNAMDPDGLVTFFIHGTWSSNSTFSSAYVQHVSTYYQDPKVRFFDWSGANNALARKEAAEALARQLAAYRGAHPCEPIRVVAHSHGGNVALLASQDDRVYINELVTLGTPIIPAFEPGNIGIWNNVSSSADFVQTHALPFGDNGRSDPTANNIRLKNFGHTALHSIATWDAALSPH